MPAQPPLPDGCGASVKVVVASGSDALVPALIERVAEIEPALPMYVFSELRPEEGLWIPYHPARTFRENLQGCRAALHERHVRYSAVLFEPRTPYWRMRLIGFLLNPVGFLAFNENLDHWMLRPRSIPAMARHGLWRLTNAVRWAMRERWGLRELGQPRLWAKAAGRVAALVKALMPAASDSTVPREWPHGVSALLLSQASSECDSLLAHELGALPHEVLAAADSAALNTALCRARYSHVCVVVNQELLRPGVLHRLHRALLQQPDLFAATIAPYPFPQSRQPIGGESGSFVIAGKVGSTLYSRDKFRRLGGLTPGGETNPFAGIELGYRAWRRGWPTISIGSDPGRPLEKRQVEAGDLRLLARIIASPRIFRRLWDQAIEGADRAVCREGWRAPAWVQLPPAGAEPEEAFLALCDGSVAIFPGSVRRNRPVILVASPYLPFPLTHGGAVRIYHLMRHTASEYDVVLVAFADQLTTPAPELLRIATEVVLVHRPGSHLRQSTERPDGVEEFDSPAFHAALRWTVRKWTPAIVQLEFTQMAQYAIDAVPAKTILVEHDITYAFHEQLLQQREDWETRRQMQRWRPFERDAWRQVDHVVTMSEADRRSITGTPATSLPNGVDLAQYRPSGREPDPARLLFVGPFSHTPNVLAIEFFLRDVWPLLAGESPALHLIAGRNYQHHLRRLRGAVSLNLSLPGVEVEEFVEDLRQAYQRATVVIAPMRASAGTKIKILEAMAAGKAIVATPSGIRGLEMTPGVDVLVGETAAELAAAITELLRRPSRRRQIESAARATVERLYGWDAIGERQARLYRSLIPS